MKSEGKQGAQNFTKSLFISLLILSGCLISLMASHARTIFVDVCYGFFLPSKIPCLVCMEFLTTSDLWCPILMSRNLCGDVIAHVFIAYHPSGVGGGFFCEIFLHQISHDWDQTDVLVKTFYCIYLILCSPKKHKQVLTK